jgi:uncharacterized membrane protein required for colicin V production
MNLIDVLLILIVVLAMWAGWAKGFIYGLTDLLIWMGSLATGFFLYQYAGNFLQKLLPSLGVWSLPLAFILTIIISRILFSLLLYSFLNAIRLYQYPVCRFLCGCTKNGRELLI